MKKLFAIIPIAIIFILLSFNYSIYAAVPNYNNVIYYCYKVTDYYNNPLGGSLYNKYITYVICSNSPINISANIQFTSNTTIYYYSANAMFGTDDPVFTTDDLWNAGNFTARINQQDYVIIGIKGSFNNYSNVLDFDTLDDYEDYINPQPTPTPVPAWYQEMWDTLKEELGNPAFWFGQWFIDIIENVYGEENDPTGPPKPPLSTHVTIGNPTLTPAPTPIPYSTIVIPKTDIITGETVYETNYYYNISGTPIITSSPPTNTPSQNGYGNGNNYTPLNGDPYSIPQLNWLTSVEIGDSNYDGIDSVGDGLSSIDEIGSDYTDGMSAVQDATGTLPVSWILLIGVAAAIPLVAGLISRFLS